MAAVEHGDRQKIHDSQIGAEHRQKHQQRRKALFRRLSGDFRNGHWPAEQFWRDLCLAQALQKAVARGVAESSIAYTSGTPPALGDDGKFQINRDKVAFGRELSIDEVDLETGFLMLASAVPAAQPAQPSGEPPLIDDVVQPPKPGSGVAPRVGPAPQVRREVNISFSATRDQLFKAFPALANLAEKSDGGRITVRVTGQSADGYDPSWLRNALEEPLDEADIEVEHKVS